MDTIGLAPIREHSLFEDSETTLQLRHECEIESYPFRTDCDALLSPDARPRSTRNNQSGRDLLFQSIDQRCDDRSFRRRDRIADG